LSCSRYRQLISRYVDNEATPRQREELLAHVQTCHDCAAWLARARQTDVLLRGMNDTGPSDRVRSAILEQVRARNTEQPPQHAPAPVKQRHTAPWLNALRLVASSLLLRFDPSPHRVALAFVATAIGLFGLAYWLNVIPPYWGYDRLGFELKADARQAVDATAIPLPAISSGNSGVGGPVAVPNLVRALPEPSAEALSLDTPVRVRFDQPMDRASVEAALSIDPPAAGAFAWDADNEVRFTPAAPGLLPGVTYTVTLTGTARSVAGTPMQEPATWSFHTAPPAEVQPVTPDGSTVPPTGSLTLRFGAPMYTGEDPGAVVLRAAGAAANLPARLEWAHDGTELTITPLAPAPLGDLYLRVAATARTAAGAALGRSAEFRYKVALPVPRVRLLDGRVIAAPAGDVHVRFEALGPEAAGLDPLNFEVYALPAEMLSALGTGAAGWPSSLPDGFPGGLQKVNVVTRSPSGTEDVTSLGALPAGLYLVVASPASPSTEFTTDWALLAVSDGSLIMTGAGSPLWATDAAGRSWVGAEVSMYGPGGALLEKGLTGESGLWQPTAASEGARLAVALDPGGHTAAVLLPDGAHWAAAAPADLTASFVTDLPAYRPGETVNFRVILRPSGTTPATPVAEQEVSVALLQPGGATLSALTLKPDHVGAVGGIFPLSAHAQAGQYTVRVRAGGSQHDFPLRVVAPTEDSLSVYVVPGTSQVGDTTITRTVSVLSALGEPAAGAVVTGTLTIDGDPWASEPITGTTNADGRVTLVAPLPDWFARFNEPALALAVEARKNSLSGTATQYVDLTSQRLTQSGMTQLVAPNLNIAVIARPVGDAPFKVRVVLLDETAAAGDVLVLARSAGGEQLAYALDMARLGDATIDVPQRFSGGTLTVMAAGKEGSRTLRLVPGRDSEANLHVVAPETVTAGADFPVRLAFTDLDGRAVSGAATLWMRRVSGALPEGPQPWEPSLAITSTGAITHTLQAPASPGLWYVTAEAVTPDGQRGRSWSVMRVEPGPWLQSPPSQSAAVGEAVTLWTTIYNPGPDALSSGVRTVVEGPVKVVSGSSQPLEVPAGEWGRLSWRVVSAQAGDGRVGFAFMPSSGTAGVWAANLRTSAGPRTDVTYTAGVTTGERAVGVAVPSGLSGDSVTLEIHASVSMLPALAVAALSPSGAGVSSAAARLSGAASVGAAYVRLNAAVPQSAAQSPVERSVLLQQIYSAQRPDGGWGDDFDPAEPSSVGRTAEVLLALQRAGGYALAGAQTVQPDMAVVNRALTFLSSEMARPANPTAGSEALDERAFGLYVLAAYRPVAPEVVRPMMLYAGGQKDGLSADGQAWLALALWQSGNSADALAVVNHMLKHEPATTGVTPAMLEAVLEAQRTLPTLQARPTDLPDYAAAADRYAQALMETRQGAGWATPATTANALSALSRYAVARGDAPESGMPTVQLGDRPVQARPASGDSATVSVVLTGNELHPGMNWLTLKAPGPERTLYYSLALTATR
jgi:hypothetical protein